MSRRVARHARILVVLSLVGLAPVVRAQSRVADPSYRDAEQQLRSAARDTIGRPVDAGHLDTLGVALLVLGREEEATKVFDRVLAIDPLDAAANAGLGKLALFHDALADADTFLTRAVTRERDPETVRDLYALRLRQSRWRDAADLAESAGEPGRRDALLGFVDHPPVVITAGPAEDRLPFVLRYPTPCVRVRIDGQSMLLAIDTGARGLLLDDGMARRVRLRVGTGQTPIDWMGRSSAVTEAVTPELQLGRFTVADVPTGLLDLRKYGLALNPRSEPVVGVIGLQVLRAFVPTFDYRRGELVLRRPEAPAGALDHPVRVSYEIRGEDALFVRGSMWGARPMTFQIHSGIPGCGVAADEGVFTEVGLHAGGVSKALGSANSWMQGMPWARVTVPTLTVGEVVQNDVPGWCLRGDTADLWRDGVRSDGFLSNDFFRGWCVTYDWSAHQMVFETAR